jgi:uncharacterized membrane protein
MIEPLKVMRLAVTIAATAVALAVPAHADDVDADFNRELHSYGIYGPRDFNSYLAKMICKRLDRGVDADAAKSVNFATTNLPRATTQPQAWKFVGASINTYCPEQRPVLERVAG